MKLYAYQFLSRTDIRNGALLAEDIYPVQAPDMKCRIEYLVENRPFETNFITTYPVRQSIGVDQYVDPYVDVYMKHRWPKCISCLANVQTPGNAIPDEEVRKNLLLFIRQAIWTLEKRHSCSLLDSIVSDQKARYVGYRREYFNWQLFDMGGSRRPSAANKYVQTDPDDYIGPGVACLPDYIMPEEINEHAWSAIISFPHRTTFEKDKEELKQRINAIRKHHNSYNELQDAKRHLDSGDLKGTIRSAASSVDAVLRFYCEMWGVWFPKKSLSFDEKIEAVLAKANRPSYQKIAPAESENLLYLYRARNTQHEGDCYYKDKTGQVVYIKKGEQAQILFDSAERFVLWIDSLA